MTEWADADLGDARRTQRLVELATVLAQRPSASLPEACGSRAQLKAAYRFFDNDANDPHASWPAMWRRPPPGWPPCRGSWPCRIPRSWTGRRTRPPPAWGPWPTRTITACMSIPRWRSRPSACRWACWPSRCGPVTGRHGQARDAQAPARGREGKPEVADQRGGRHRRPGAVSADPFCLRRRPGSRCV